MSKQERPNLRTTVIQAAKDADVELSDYDRAIVLGQLAELIGKHPKVGGKIAFKGGAIMTLVDGSARLSRDLDGSMIAGGKISKDTIREALSTPEARKIVKRVDLMGGGDKTSIRFPVIVCHPISGQGEVEVSMSIHWDAPLIIDPVRETVRIHGREIKLLVMARPERIAEKLRAFVGRGFDRDAYDLHHSWKIKGISASEQGMLSSLVHQKIAEDSDIPPGIDLHGEFDDYMKSMPGRWDKSGYLILLSGALPAWPVVAMSVAEFKRFLPKHK